MAMGQKENPEGPHVLVYFSFYRVFWVPFFDPKPIVLPESISLILMMKSDKDIVHIIHAFA